MNTAVREIYLRVAIAPPQNPLDCVMQVRVPSREAERHPLSLNRPRFLTIP